MLAIERGRLLRCSIAAAVLLLAAAPIVNAGNSDCCYDNGAPGCGNFGCENIVCGQDPFCCVVTWDLNCAREAETLCGLLCTPGGQPCPGTGDCCAASSTPGCDDETCCATVCAADAYCCEGRWDVFCAADARALCAGCAAVDPCARPGAGDCCSDNGGPGCDDLTCCETICVGDAFCCDVRWDLTCAIQAEATCSGLCGVVCPVGGDCCLGHATPGCDDESCCAAVCSSDPTCCFAIWDALCAAAAAVLCDACGGGFGGDCCAPNQTPGCDDPECTATICSVDPFCCDIEWDQICVDEAIDLCGALCSKCPLPCPGDVTGDGEVSVEDVVLVITSWGGDGSDGGDTNCDGIIDVADLVAVVLGWGPCDTGV